MRYRSPGWIRLILTHNSKRLFAAIISSDLNRGAEADLIVIFWRMNDPSAGSPRRPVSKIARRRGQGRAFVKRLRRDIRDAGGCKFGIDLLSALGRHIIGML